jgi:hypothetical protein
LILDLKPTILPEINKRWFRDYNFANSVLNFGINYLLMLINSYFTKLKLIKTTKKSTMAL